MRQCNICSNRECHKIHAPKAEYVKTADGEYLKPMELRVKHAVPRRMMMEDCKQFKPIDRSRGATVLEHVIHNSPVELATILERMRLKIVDVTYYPYFRIVSMHTPHRKKGRKVA